MGILRSIVVLIGTGLAMACSAVHVAWRVLFNKEKNAMRRSDDNGPPTAQPRHGFVYVAKAHNGPMAHAEAGRSVRIPGRGPPWIAVDHELCSVVVARWPGKLWAVEIVDPITEGDLKAANQVGLRPDAGYTRAAVVKILHAVPVATLFGPHGEQVCAVIETAAALTMAQAMRLGESRHRDAGDAHRRVWRGWLVRENIPLDRYSDDLDGTLAIGASKMGSPIGQGLKVIDGVVGRRAETLAGPTVWLVDEADPEGAWLAEPWSAASLALLDAALAFGAPDLVTSADNEVLTAAWRMLERDR
jgi:hypothetical protein